MPPPTADTREALSFNGVSKVFSDGTRALESITFDVEPGRIVALVGPSGCGKSTLLRIASGLDLPTEGTCSVDITSIGYVFQDASLMPWRTVQRNVELFAELHGIPAAERRAAAEAAIALVGLEGFGSKYPVQLSGGMRMRASLARSLVLGPRLFLFDEPFGALDEMTRERLNDELLALHSGSGFAGLFVTHSIAEAVFLSSRVLVMSERPGRIVAAIDVPFGYPRGHDLRYDADFGRVCAEVSASMRGDRP